MNDASAEDRAMDRYLLTSRIPIEERSPEMLEAIRGTYFYKRTVVNLMLRDLFGEVTERLKINALLGWLNRRISAFRGVK